jgi:glycosyltransferase involved in cell wall biosynthesis
MNILLVNYEYPPIGGGAGNRTYNYAKEFVKQSQNVVVLTSAYNGFKGYSFFNNVHHYRIPAFRTHVDRSNPFQMLCFNISSLFSVKKIIKEHDISLVFAILSIPSGITAYYIFKRFKIPYIISLGGSDVPKYNDKVKIFHRLLQPLRRKILKNARFITAPSNGLAELSRKTDDYPVIVIPTGVDILKFKPLPKKETEELSFIFVGRFNYIKNIELIIDQFYKLIKSGIKAKLSLVGNGPLFNKISEQIFKLKLNDFVSFYYWVDKSEITTLYQEQDIIINASTIEGLSNVLLEAMASGLAVIASDVVGNNDLITNEKNGLLFSLEKPDDLYKTMLKLAQNKELLNNLKKESRRYIEEHHSWEKSAKKYFDLIIGM